MSLTERATRTLECPRAVALRVLHILPSTYESGAERQVIELLAGMRAHDIVTALLTLYQCDFPSSDLLPFQTLSAAPGDGGNGIFLLRLVREIRSFRPHIVHTHTKLGRYWGRAAALFAGVPHIVHTEHSPCDPRRSGGERILDAVLNAMTERVVTFFEEQAAYLSANGGWPREKFALIPNGIAPPLVAEETRESARAALQLPHDRFVVFLVGRMNYQKNQALALHALAALHPELRSRMLLCFAGSGEHESLLRETSRRLDVAQHVRFLGYRENVQRLLPAADLVLMTSHFEGMPSALLEAMASNVPILSTPWIGARSMLGDGRYGFIARSFQPYDVAHALERAIAHPAACRTVSRNAYEFVQETYCIARTIAAHMHLYRNLCAAAAA